MKTETKQDYELARDELNELFASLKLPVVISAPVGVVGEGDWPCIRYSVAIAGEFFEYSLGIGHVKAEKLNAMLFTDRLQREHGFTESNGLIKSMVECISSGKRTKSEYANLSVRIHAVLAKIQGVKPNPAEVLASVCREGMDADESFESWCGNLGYDADSRKAEAIYRACADNGKKARRILSPANFAKFAELSNRL